jgi:hypothetical protein
MSLRVGYTGASPVCNKYALERISSEAKSTAMPSKTLFLLVLIIAVLSGACGTAPSETNDHRSSQEVLETAQARAEATRAATFQTPPPTPITPSPTAPLVTDTPVPSITPTPSQPIAVADYNAYVRSGPDETYENVDFLLQGQRGIILGMYENESSGTWWFIDRIEEGKDGWIWSGAVTVSGNVIGVPVLEAPSQ